MGQNMENKNVGGLIVGIGLVIGLMVLIFNTILKDLIYSTCTHGPTCGMYDTLSIQTWISLSIVAIIIIIGIIIMFTKPDEKKVIKLLQEENGGMFQADLMEKLEIGKVKATRLLDKLEAKQLIERKRRGMNNLVVLRN